ncbi:lysozyme [Desulfococcus sp.]|uniref:lysozyme n=1 Tax=Desulfococcus sp. TaxID=2025834 RepID=UPI003593C1AC
MKRLPYITLSVIAAAVALIWACRNIGSPVYLSVDKITAGIFLEEERAVLPPGVELRGIYEKGLKLTKDSEGFRNHLYNDAARYCTIAYGHLVKLAPCDGSEPSHFLDGVTEPEGADLLRDDMETAETVVLTAVDVELTDGQYAALCDFVYNVGGGNFRSSTLRKVVNRKAFGEVPFQLRRWVKAGGREFPGLKTRREREIELFFENMTIPRAVPPADMDLTPIDIREGES